MIGMGILFFIFPGLYEDFTDDARVFPYAYLTMRIMAYIQIPESIGFNGRALRAGEPGQCLALPWQEPGA